MKEKLNNENNDINDINSDRVIEESNSDVKRRNFDLFDLFIAYIIVIIFSSVQTFGLGLYFSGYDSCSNSISITNMSISEMEEYNSLYTNFQGKQKGVRVRILLNQIESIYEKYDDVEVPYIVYVESKDNLDKIKTSCAGKNIEDYNHSNYYKYVQFLNDNLDLNHNYYILVNNNSSGLIGCITIYYDNIKETEENDRSIFYDYEKDIVKDGKKKMDNYGDINERLDINELRKEDM